MKMSLHKCSATVVGLAATLFIVVLLVSVDRKEVYEEFPSGRHDTDAGRQPYTPVKNVDVSAAREASESFHHAVVMLRAGRYRHALVTLTRVLELAPGMPEAHVNMGFGLLGLERYEPAHSFFQSALELNRLQSNAYYGLAIVYEHRCDYARARGAMRTYIHLAQSGDKFLPRARAALWEWEGLDGSEAGSSGVCPGTVTP